MPYLPRSKEAYLTALKTAARERLQFHEARQKNIMHITPKPTRKSERLCKDILVPISRHRITNGVLRRVGLLGRVQAARVALLNEDIEKCVRLAGEWRWWKLMDDLQWLADNGGGPVCFSVVGWVP
jgi:hypothetical protein